MIVAGIGHGGFLTFPMAPSTKVRNVTSEDGRIEILVGLRCVRSMAIRTIGGNRVALSVIFPVLTRLIVLDLRGVTHRAIHYAAIAANGLPRHADIGVALDAGVPNMSGTRDVLFVDVQGYFFPVHYFLQVSIAMTGHA
jgi:hypothetical protein